MASAEAARTSGDMTRAMRDADAAVAQARAARPLDPVLLADALVQRCDVQEYVDPALSKTFCGEALGLRLKALGPDARETLNLQAQLALGRLKADPVEVEATMQDIVSRLDRLATDAQGRADAGDARAGLAFAMKVNGKVTDALANFSQAVALLETSTDVGRGNAALYLSTVAEILVSEGRVQEAIEASHRALAIHLRYHDPANVDVVTTRSALGAALIQAGRYAEAEDQLRAAVDALDKAKDVSPSFRARAYRDLGRFLVQTGRARSAEPLFERALEIRRTSPNTSAVTHASAVLDWAESLRAEGRIADARLAVLHAQELLKGVTDPTVAPAARLRLALVERDGGNLTAAQAEADAAVAALADLPDAGARQADAWLTSGMVSRLRGDLANAGRSLERAEAALRTRPARDPNRLLVQAELARVRLQQGDLDAASRLAEAAAETETGMALDKAQLAGFGGAGAADRSRDIFTLALDVAWARSGAAAGPRPLSDAVFAHAQMAITSRAALALSGAATRLAAADPELGRRVRARQDANEAFARADDALAAARRSSDAPPPALVKAAVDARAALDAADQELARRFPAYRDLVGGAPLTIAQAQALLRPDEAIVLILPTAAGTYQLVLRPGSAVWSRSDYDAAHVHAAFVALRGALDPGGGVRGLQDASGAAARLSARAFPRQTAHALYRGVWAGGSTALQGASVVYVATAGDLVSLPLSLLVTTPPSGDDADPAALRRTAWLVRRHALVTLPAVANLRALRAAPAQRSTAAAFVGFGDPRLTTSDAAATRTAAQATLADLPSLPGTRRELQSMAQVLGAPASSIRVDVQATESAVKQADLTGVRVVAFATHGLLAGDLPGAGEPALVFTPPQAPQGEDDGLLTASEAARLSLASDWIVLSACNTAGPDGAPDGEGLSGLTRAFFYAGAPSVLASHWRVRDDAAGAVTVQTLQRYAKSPAAGRARALQGAMLAVLDDKAPGHADPAVWAPFVVVGEGR